MNDPCDDWAKGGGGTLAVWLIKQQIAREPKHVCKTCGELTPDRYMSAVHEGHCDDCTRED